MPKYKTSLEWGDPNTAIGRPPFYLIMEAIHEDEAAQNAEELYPGYIAYDVVDAPEDSE